MLWLGLKFIYQPIDNFDQFRQLCRNTLLLSLTSLYHNSGTKIQLTKLKKKLNRLYDVSMCDKLGEGMSWVW